MIDAFKAWAEQFARRLGELGACVTAQRPPGVATRDVVTDLS